MNGLFLYWSPRDETGNLVGKIWIEDNKVLVDAEDPAVEQELRKMLVWLEQQKLCTRIAWADFETFETIDISTVCQPDDLDYMGTVQRVLEGYLILEKPIHAERM